LDWLRASSPRQIHLSGRGIFNDDFFRIRTLDWNAAPNPTACSSPELTTVATFSCDFGPDFGPDLSTADHQLLLRYQKIDNAERLSCSTGDPAKPYGGIVMVCTQFPSRWDDENQISVSMAERMLEIRDRKSQNRLTTNAIGFNQDSRWCR
jgi:hypothetical protein